jgi:multicomponent Na+:H+ antiporter subunit F
MNAAIPLFTSIILFLTIGGGLVRVLIGPTRTDRMLTVQLFGTTGVAILLLLAEMLSLPDLRDVALIFALLAAVVTINFVKSRER